MLYVEIYNSNILLAHICPTKTIAHKIVKLSCLSVNQNIILGPKEITTHITEFILTNKLRKPWTVINVPNILQSSGTTQTLAILQHALVISKAPLKIQKLIATQILSNDFTQQNYINNVFKIAHDKTNPNLMSQIQNSSNSSPILWFYSTAICTICTVLILVFISLNQNKKLTDLKTKSSLYTTNSSFTSKIKEFKITKNQNFYLHQTIDKINKYITQTQNPQKILTVISQSIPDDTWLSEIKLEKIKKLTGKSNQPSSNKKLKQQSIELIGYSKQIESPLIFMKRLTPDQNTGIKNLNFAYLKKIKNQQTQADSSMKAEKLFEFKINGNITYT